MSNAGNSLLARSSAWCSNWSSYEGILIPYKQHKCSTPPKKVEFTSYSINQGNKISSQQQRILSDFCVVYDIGMLLIIELIPFFKKLNVNKKLDHGITISNCQWTCKHKPYQLNILKQGLNNRKILVPSCFHVYIQPPTGTFIINGLSKLSVKSIKLHEKHTALLPLIGFFDNGYKTCRFSLYLLILEKSNIICQIICISGRSFSVGDLNADYGYS